MVAGAKVRPPATKQGPLKLNSVRSAPLKAGNTTVAGAVPALLSVNVCTKLVPTATELPKLNGAELSQCNTAIGVFTAMPVPTMATLFATVLALVAITNWAGVWPVTAGVKTMWMAQLAPTATLVPQVWVTANAVLVAVMLLMAKAAVPELVRVTV